MGFEHENWSNEIYVLENSKFFIILLQTKNSVFLIDSYGYEVRTARDRKLSG